MKKFTSKRRLSSKAVLLGLAILFSVPLALIAFDDNSASADSVWNVNDGYGGYRTGYFSGSYAPHNLDGGNGNVITDGIPAGLGDGNTDSGGYADEVDELIKYIREVVYPRGGRDKVGASFLVHSMIGKPQPDGYSSIDLTDQEWAEWSTRLKQPGLHIDWNIKGCIDNDTYMNTGTDVARSDIQVCNQDLVVFKLDNNIVYKINRKCANPDGRYDGLPKYTPPPVWSITPTSEVDSITGTTSKTSAKIGSTVTWNHYVQNNGPNTVDKNLAAHYQNRTNASGGDQWNDIIVDETGLGGSLKSIRQGRCLDVEAASMTLVRQWTCNGTAQQLWRYDSTNQTFKLARDTTRCLNATGGSDGAQVNLVACNASTQQKWILDSAGFIRSVRYATKCMDTGNDNNEEVSKIYACHSPASDFGGNQIWIKGTEGDDHIIPSGTLGSKFREPFVSSYKITAADLGKRLCRSTSVNPNAWNNTNWAESTAACVTVPYDFNLVPAISSVSGVVEAGASIPDITPTVDNRGTTRTEGDSQWQLTKIIVSPTGTIATSLQENNKLPCTTYGNTCTVEDSGSQAFPLGLTPLDVLSGQTAPANAPVGTKICFALSVQPYMVGTSNWRHGIPVCIVVGKTPKVQVLGGDLVVGRGTANNPARISNVGTANSYSPSAGRTYGSWSEYAIIPSGTVKGMASGALYVGGATSNDLCSLSVLTISNSSTVGSINSCSAGSIGKYASSTLVPNAAERFPVPNPTPTAQKLVTTSATPVKDISALPGSRVYTSEQPVLDINSSADFGAGHWVVINAQNTTVKIKSNINYTSGTLTKISDIPQVVIIAKNILIDPGVTKVDAWLIATGKPTASEPIAGYISTCSSVTAGSPTSATVNAAQCKDKLTVNGPVQANRLFMYRTAGAGTGASTGDPAEVFNLRADAYVWASAYSPGTGRVPTVDTKELPPRF